MVVTEDIIRQDLHLDDADGVKCLPNDEIFIKLKLLIHTLVQCVSTKRTAWNEFSCSMASAVICLATVDDVTSYNTKYTSFALTQKVFANIRRVGKGFYRVRTPLFASMLVQPQDAEEEEDEISTAPTPSSPTNILKLKKSVKKLKKKKKSRSLSLKRLRKGRITQEDVNVATKDVIAVKPTVFDDEEVTMTMAQTLINMKAKKVRLLNEQMAQRLHDKKIEKAIAREKLEKDDLERAQVLQKQYDGKEENIDWNAIAEQIKEKHLDNIRKYQSLKRKPVSIAQARKNMIIYLKNIDGYKMEILDESFKKLKAVEVLGSESTQETPTNEPKEMSKEDVQNMLEIFPVSEFMVKA
nr:hypothetical protein [Tanacetum cinerariifolium]